MFTGIIESIGEIIDIENTGGDQRFRIRTGEPIRSSLGIGDSIAVNGVCLTVTATGPDSIEVDISNETLSCTALGKYAAGHKVNLERALSVSDRLDGHLVSGHVDGIASVTDLHDDGRSKRMVFTGREDYMRYIVKKGSVCIDGTSLTVNNVDDTHFDINVIPHTLEQTIMSGYGPGKCVNIEVDIVARYIEKLLPGDD